MNYELFMGEALAEAGSPSRRGSGRLPRSRWSTTRWWPGPATGSGRAEDPTAHAVVTALREAARRLGPGALADATVFCTREPCPMCVGALLESDVGALVYAVPNIVDGAAGTVIQLAQHPGLRRRLQVVSGIRQAEAEELFARHR